MQLDSEKRGGDFEPGASGQACGKGEYGKTHKPPLEQPPALGYDGYEELPTVHIPPLRPAEALQVKWLSVPAFGVQNCPEPKTLLCQPEAKHPIDAHCSLDKGRLIRPGFTRHIRRQLSRSYLALSKNHY